jgi:hypothetical protein
LEKLQDAEDETQAADIDVPQANNEKSVKFKQGKSSIQN